MKQTVDLIILESKALGADFQTPAISVAPYQLVSVQIIFDMSGGATTAGSVSLQSSNDGINFSYSLITSVIVYLSFGLIFVICDTKSPIGRYMCSNSFF